MFVPLKLTLARYLTTISFMHLLPPVSSASCVQPLALWLGLVPEGDVFREAAWHLGRLPEGAQRAAVSGVTSAVTSASGVWSPATAYLY